MLPAVQYDPAVHCVQEAAFAADIKLPLAQDI
jgi:hypothetical protein